MRSGSLVTIFQFLNIGETVETIATTGRGVAYEGSPELFELYWSARARKNGGLTLRNGRETLKFTR